MATLCNTEWSSRRRHHLSNRQIVKDKRWKMSVLLFWRSLVVTSASPKLYIAPRISWRHSFQEVDDSEVKRERWARERERERTNRNLNLKEVNNTSFQCLRMATNLIISVSVFSVYFYLLNICKYISYVFLAYIFP